MKIKREVKIGMIATATLLVVFWGFNFLKGKDLFKLTDDYTILYRNVNGLLESNPVLISGYRIGQVKSINFDLKNPEFLRVTISITYGTKIPIGTKAQISSLDLLGSKGIDLKIGPSNTLYSEFDTIPGIEEIPIFDKIDPLKDKAENILQSVDTIVNSVKLLLNREMILELRDAITNIRDVTSNLNNQKNQINETLENIKIITNNIKQNNEHINHIMANIDAISDTVKKAEIKKTIHSTQLAIDEATILLKTINKGTGTLGKISQSDSVYNQILLTTNQLNKLLIDIQDNPKKYVHFSVFGNKNSEKKP